MAVFQYDILVKLAESSAAEALRSAIYATEAKPGAIETARAVFEHAQRASDYLAAAKAIPPSSTQKDAMAAISASAAASVAHTAVAAIYQAVAQDNAATSGKSSGDLSTQLKNSAASQASAHNSSSAATILLSGLASATSDLKLLITAGINANRDAARCNTMLAKIYTDSALSKQEGNTPQAPAAPEHAAVKPNPAPTTQDIKGEAFRLYSTRPRQSSEEIAADRDWFEAKSNLLSPN